MSRYLREVLRETRRALLSAASSAQCEASRSHAPSSAVFFRRPYRSMPTHGIGKYSHLLPRVQPKPKKGKLEAKQLKAATDTEFGVLNVCVSGFDMTLVEHYSQHIHKLCNHLHCKVNESYALPTTTTEVMVMPTHGTKMFVDSVLRTHWRVVQVSEMKATVCAVFLEVLLKNQPEGVQLRVTEHAEADFLARFKARPELEGLIAKMNN